MTEVDAVSLKLPTFWTSTPTTWFAQAEAQFIVRNITNDDTKYYYVVAALDSSDSTANRAKSLLVAPPTNRYDAIKTFLTSAYELSNYERATALYNLAGLGDSKPSKLMDTMLGLMGDNKPCILFHHLFLLQLPTYVRSQLAHKDFTDLRELSLEADNIYLADKATGQHVQEVNAASLATRQRPNRSSSTSSAESLCYYHRIYGTRARKCCEPCKHHATFQQKKLDPGPTANVSTAGPHQQQLLVTDSISGRCFLVDTGAQVSVVPATLCDKHSGSSDEHLQTANGTSISTYGAQHVSLRLGTSTYNVRLVKADVKRPLLGADFLRQ